MPYWMDKCSHIGHLMHKRILQNEARSWPDEHDPKEVLLNMGKCLWQILSAMRLRYPIEEHVIDLINWGMILLDAYKAKYGEGTPSELGIGGKE